MEKKHTIISLIAIAIIIGCTIAYIIISGMVAQKYNYVQIEVNPRIEFICDRKFDVISSRPLNEDAEIVMSDLDLIGLDVDDATTTFLNECARCGYIDVNGIDNATNVTVIDGITQALDVHVTQKVYNYFRKNEIMSVVSETYEDRNTFDEKKKNNVPCSNKYKLITTIIESSPNYTIQELNKLSEVELVDIVISKHKDSPYTPTDDLIAKKQQLIKDNQSKYNTHIKSISNNSQKEFSELFEDFQKISGKKYFENFKKEYEKWQYRNGL